MRFEDSLSTVLASQAAPGFGAAATWRQLVDLIGRGRVEPDDAAIARLRGLRGDVPQPVRAGSARALAFARPPAPLVALFAEDELAVAAPVLRTANLTGAEWVTLLPALSSAGRSVLRHRRDLPQEAVRGLASFGAVDFVLGHDGAAEAAEPAVAVPLTETPFQSLGAIASELPVVVEARRRADEPADEPTPEALPAGGYRIADLVARIDAFQRRREEEVPEAAPAVADSFRFETDAAGTIRRVDGAPRAALVGVSLAHSRPQGLAQFDAIAAGAFRHRARFAEARLTVDGDSAAAGTWRIDAMPAFDEPSGRFIGYRGVARRPRADQSAGPSAGAADSGADSLRQLVHELRTPTNAIAGFAELIETELLGPVEPVYRERAGAIRRHTAALLGAIDDLDTAARLESRALDLRPATVAMAPLIGRLLGELAPLARLRTAGIVFDPAGDEPVRADDRAVERVVGRLLAALLSVAAPGERLKLRLKTKGSGTVALDIDRPAALAAIDDGALFNLDADAASDAEGAPLLGTGFALRLVRNLAAELGGSLAVGGDRLTLRLPAALDREVKAAR